MLLLSPGANELGFVFAGLKDEALLSDDLGREMLSPTDLLGPGASGVDGNFKVLWPEPEPSVDEGDGLLLPEVTGWLPREGESGYEVEVEDLTSDEFKSTDEVDRVERDGAGAPGLMGPEGPIDGRRDELSPDERGPGPELCGRVPPVVKLDAPKLGEMLENEGEELNGPLVALISLLDSMELALNVRVSVSVVVRSVICVVDSFVAMVVTQLLTMMFGLLVVRTALLESEVKTTTGFVGEELMVGVTTTFEVRSEISGVEGLMTDTVTWVLVVMIGRVSDSVLVVELSINFDETSSVEEGPLEKAPLNGDASEVARPGLEALEEDLSESMVLDEVKLPMDDGRLEDSSPEVGALNVVGPAVLELGSGSKDPVDVAFNE